MAEHPERSDFSAASHAYEHVEHAGDRLPHRVDLVDAPRWPLRPRVPAPPVTGRPSQIAPVIVHRLEPPSAFKLGFGFAAGMWTFRALVLIVVWTVLLAALSGLLRYALPT